MNDLTKPPFLLIVNTWVVLTGIAMFVASAISIIMVLSEATPHALMGALFFPLPSIIFAVCIFRSVFRRSSQATKAATVTYFVLAGLILFGLISNIAEAVYEGKDLDRKFLFYFTSISLALTAYMVFLGFLSMRWGRRCDIEKPKGSNIN